VKIGWGVAKWAATFVGKIDLFVIVVSILKVFYVQSIYCGSVKVVCEY
jgi:uncharacterized membrane protein (Fun14 family)